MYSSSKLRHFNTPYVMDMLKCETCGTRQAGMTVTQTAHDLFMIRFIFDETNIDILEINEIIPIVFRMPFPVRNGVVIPLQGAVEAFQKDLRNDRFNHETMLRLAHAHFCLKEYRKTIPLLEKCVSHNPAWGEAWLMLATSFRQTDRDVKAVSTLQKGIRHIERFESYGLLTSTLEE